MASNVPPPLSFILILALLLLFSKALFRDHTIVIRVPARYESIRMIVSLMRSAAKQAQLGDHEIFECRLALDEACVNIIEHAYASSDSGEIEVVVRAVPGVCTICLTDFGTPYDPSQVPVPSPDLSLEDATPGGLGLYLMRRVMDDIQYVASPHGNSLVMVKRQSPIRS